MSSVDLVQASDLTRDFPAELKGYRIRAVDSLSFSMRPGSVMGLLGPNGSGKSTTIKMILGLLRPTSGTLTVNGKAPTDRLTRRHIGYLPEAPYFQKFLTGREFVQSMGRLSGLKRNELNERTRSVLEQVDMTGAADRRIGTYSKGMLQRIGLAQALVHDPDFLILDEPTAGVDPIGSAAIARLILDLKRTGKSILLCSHLLTEVEGLCDQLLMLYRGRMLLSGTTEDILEAGDVWSLQVSGYAMNRESAARMALEVEGLKLISARASGRHLSDVFLEKIHAVEADRDD